MTKGTKIFIKIRENSYGHVIWKKPTASIKSSLFTQSGIFKIVNVNDLLNRQPPIYHLTYIYLSLPLSS